MGGSHDLEKINNMKRDILSIPEHQALVFPSTKIYERIRSKLDSQIIQAESMALNYHNNKSVTLVDNPPLAVCAGFEASGVLSSLSDKSIADEVLAAAKWGCLEEVLGENGAEGCTPLSIIADVYDGIFLLGEYCTGRLGSF